MPKNSKQPVTTAEANDSRTASDKAVVCKELLGGNMSASQRWKKRNAERVRAYDKNYQQTHKAGVAAKNRKYRKAHPDALKKWRKQNNEAVRAYTRWQTAEWRRKKGITGTRQCFGCKTRVKKEDAINTGKNIGHNRWLCDDCAS